MEDEKKLYSVQGRFWENVEIETNGKMRNTAQARFVVFEKHLDYRTAKKLCKENKNWVIMPDVTDDVLTISEEFNQQQATVELIENANEQGVPEQLPNMAAPELGNPILTLN